MGSNLYRKNITIIGVTGSVGKTTTVGFLEHMLKKAGKNVVRFYSKRIFPLSLMTHFVNKVDKNTEYVVMEYSLFYKDHIEVLSKILAPDFAYIMNILNMHIEKRLGFENMEDIFMAKSKIYVKSETKRLFLHDSISCYKKLLEYEKDIEIFGGGEICFEIESMPPTIRTQQMLQVGMSLIVNILGLSKSKLEDFSGGYNPVESRIILFKIDDSQKNSKKVYFHGETSTAERMRSLIETDENNPCHLFIDEINFGQADPLCFWKELIMVFERPETYVLDTINNRFKLGNIKANYLIDHKFRWKLRNTKGYVAYHKSMFVRQNDISVQDYLTSKFS